jgi:TolB protein
MTRLTLIGIALFLAGCAGEPQSAGPDLGLVVDDSLGNMTGTPSPSPDGTRIAFNRTVAGRSNVFVIGVDGSNPVQLTRGVWDVAPALAWSPDGRWIAYHAEDPDFDVFVVASDGSSSPRQLTSGPERDFPSEWLPDGSGIVVNRTAVGNEHPVVVPLDGGPVRRLGPELTGDLHGGVSPDGTRLAFDVHTGSGQATIWVQDLAPGSAPRQLTTEGLENLAGPFAWSPDGTSLLYTSERTGTRDIWILDVTSGSARQLTSDVRNDIQPRWSPDGRFIAFLSDRGGQTDLWIQAAAGGAAQRVTNDRAIETPARWSSDGQSLFFRSARNEDELVVMPPDGGAPRILVSLPGYTINSANLAPDGATALYSTNRSGNFDIWSVPTAGGEPAVFAASPLSDGNPRFSPDGSQVLFSSDRGGQPDLWLAPAGGGEPRQLTNDRALEGETAWSPDGKHIVFSSTRGGAGGDLWTQSVGGGEAMRLTTGSMRPFTPHWSRDGRSIYFVGERPGGGRELYRVSATGGTPQPLGARPGIGTADLSPDGTQLAYSSFEGGWAFVDLIPAAGGAPQRVTRKTEAVFQPSAVWTRDGSSLLVHDLDLEANRDATDLFSLRLADSTWQRLTQTPRASEFIMNLSADGRQVLVGRTATDSRILRANLASLLGAVTAR